MAQDSSVMRETASVVPAAAPSRELSAPLLGRSAEISVLRAAASGCRTDTTPRVVTLLGASGVGKSRIVGEFLSEIEAAGELRVYRSRAPKIPLSYGLFQRLLRARFGISEGADSHAAREQVRVQVAEVLDDRKSATSAFSWASSWTCRFSTVR